jgi:hypothetical protein
MAVSVVDRLVSLRVLLAPGLKHASGVTDDPADLEVAERVVDAFDGPGGGVLSRAEIAERAGYDPNEERFSRRFEVFVDAGMIRPFRSKKHQQRYTLDPVALIGQELLLRFARRGGAEELHELLVAAADRLAADNLDIHEARTIVRRLTLLLTTFAADLERITEAGTIEELLAVRHGHDTDRQFKQVRIIAELVRTRFDRLLREALRLWDAGSRYQAAVNRMLDRLLQEVPMITGGGLLAVLDEETYRDAAFTRRTEELAAVATHLVVDAPVTAVDLATLHTAAQAARQQPRARTIPEPAGDAGRVNPFERARARVEQRRRAIVQWAEQQLAHHDEVDLTDQLDGWPQAAIRLAHALALARDPAVPITADLSQVQLVDPDAQVALKVPVRLRRQAPLMPVVPSVDQQAELEDEEAGR